MSDVPKYVLADGDSYLHGVNDKLGYWEKTSSVNFCERDFEFNPFVAEFHNTWSSLIIIILPVLGLWNSNPTKEFRFTLAYLILMITGAGSVTLHTTLSSLGQKLDEIPMLWMCTVILYCLLDNTSKGESEKKLAGRVVPFFCIAFVVCQTLIYFRIQSLYEVFVTGYLTMVVTIMFWTAKICWMDDQGAAQSLLRGLWLFSVLNYVIIGSAVWMLDMYACEQWRQYYDLLGGMTWHVIWHMGAACATYCTIQQLIVQRLVTLGLQAKLVWKFHFLPVIVKEEKKKKKMPNGNVKGDNLRRSPRLRPSRRD